jgi:hypothetical protein
MNKLPVFKTVGQVFGFVVERRFFTLLRLIWFPAFLSVVAGVGPAAYQIQKLGADPEPPQLVALYGDPTYQLLAGINVVASFVLSAIIAVCVHRLIFFDDRRPGTFFYLRLTGDELRYMAALFLYTLLLLIAFAIPLIAHFAIAAQEAPGIVNDPAAAAGMLKDPRALIAFALGLVFLLVAVTRFGLVFPTIVAEGRLSFARSWQLTRGNFWRLIGFWIVTGILAFLLIMLLVIVLAAAVAAMVGSVMLGGETVGALGIIVFAVPAAVSLLVYVVVGVTLFIAALSFSYKALAGEVPQREVFE